MRGKSNQNKLQ